MRTRRTTVSGALVTTLGLALLATTGCSGTAAADKAGGHDSPKPVELTLTTPIGTTIEFDSFLRNVRKLSDGSIRIRVETGAHHSEGPDYEEQVLLDLKLGRADIAVVGSRVFDHTSAPSLGALTAPLLITSYDAQDKVLAAPVAREMVRAMDGDGLTGLGLLPGGLRHPFGARTPLLGPADYKGRMIGMQESSVSAATVRALGAEAASLQPGGPVDDYGGYEQHLNSVDGNQYDKTGMIGTANVVLWPRPVAIVASTKTFQRLNKDQRSVLRKAAQLAAPGSSEVLRRDDKEALGNLCRRGQKFATASPSQLAALRTAVQPVYDQLARDPQTKENLDAITSLVRGIPAEPTLSCADVRTIE